MYIDKQTVHGRTYLRLVNRVIDTDENGCTKMRLKTICRLGKLEDLDDGKPDYLERLRQSFADGHPILPQLEQYAVDNGQTVRKCIPEITITFTNTGSKLPRYNFANCLLDAIFGELGLPKLLSRIKAHNSINYDLIGIVRLLVYTRLMWPGSKMNAMERNESFYAPPVRSTKFNPFAVYSALDVLWSNRDRILRTVHNSITNKCGRDTSVLMYDVTNIFFQVDDNDCDTEADGVCVQPGLRKRGVSKEGRKKPIVQVALFVDRDGIPVAIQEFPGNVPDVSTMRPSLETLLQVTGIDRFVFVADRGICSNHNRIALARNGIGYIIAKSIQKSSREVQNWILDDSGWTYESAAFRYKSRIRTIRTKDENGQNYELTQKEIVYWSEKYYRKELEEHSRVVEFFESLQHEDGSIPIEKLEKAYVKKNFHKEVFVRDEDGNLKNESIPKKDLFEKIDRDKLKRDIALLGYYQIVTSELEMPDPEVIKTYKSLVEIEDEFREMKGELEMRPVYVRTPEHISAHLIVCFLALTLMHLIQKRITKAHNLADSEKLWTWGMSGDRVKAALNNWQLVRLAEGYYAFTEEGGEAAAKGVNADLDLLLSAYGISITDTITTKGALKRVKPMGSII